MLHFHSLSQLLFLTVKVLEACDITPPLLAPPTRPPVYGSVYNHQNHMLMMSSVDFSVCGVL